MVGATGIVGIILVTVAGKQWYEDRLPEVEMERMEYRRVFEKARIDDERARQSWEISDSTIAGIARKYGGVLTTTVLAYETNESLDMAERSLRRYVEHGEAKRVQSGDMRLYDIPSARVHLLGVDRMIVELLLASSGQSSRVTLLRGSGLTVESLDAALKRLETQGIITGSVRGNYRLVAVGN
jgi:hypothetical protein